MLYRESNAVGTNKKFKTLWLEFHQCTRGAKRGGARAHILEKDRHLDA